MSQLIAPPPAEPPGEKSRRRPRWLPPLFVNPETRSVEIGIAGTILVHLILLLLAPWLLQTTPATDLKLRKPAVPRQFNIELTPESFMPPPPKFVEANPNANQNIPDKTRNFAAQNQTVAQEKPTPNGKSDRPALEGRKNFDSTQIVSGQLDRQPPSRPSPPVRTSSARPPSPAPKRAQSPLSGYDKSQGDDKDSYGSDRFKPMPESKISPQQTQGSTDATAVPFANTTTPDIDPLHPQPRRTLAQHVRPAIFAENKVGTSNIGLTAIDARWSSYGEYLQRLIETIQIEWYRVLGATDVQPPVGTTVTVKFRMDSRGRITEILKVDSTSSEQGKDACLSAITNRSPYGPWTQDMIATLGNSQDLTFTFYYIGD